MKISLIHPSRGRPEKAKSTFHYWMDNAVNPENIEHILSLDFSDKKNGEYERFDKLTIDHNDCVVEATNSAAKIATGDILIYLSDDFKCPENWDEKILNRFSTIENPLLIKVDDCLQPFNKDVLTIPIMNRILYKRLGYFFHPGYKSMFCDQQLYWICKKNHWLIQCEDLKFPHEHYSIGKSNIDDTYKRSNLNWEQGKELYNQHKLQNFPI